MSNSVERRFVLGGGRDRSLGNVAFEAGAP